MIRSAAPPIASSSSTICVRKERGHGGATDRSRLAGIPRAMEPPPTPPGGGIAVAGVLPADLLFEVLLRLSAREVCRLRAVCTSWRSLTYDLRFVAAHASLHPAPLLAVLSQRAGGAVATAAGIDLDLVDLSGDVVKRIPTALGHEHRLLHARSSDRVFIRGINHGITAIDPATGSVSALPVGMVEDLALTDSHSYPSWTAFGQVPSTGEYKLLRIVEDLVLGYDAVPICEVFTFGEERFGQWRKKESPPAYLDAGCTGGTVVNGVAYFLFSLDMFDYLSEHPFDDRFKDIEPDCIPSFDLETERWSADLRGPFNRIVEEPNGLLNDTEVADHRLVLVELEGYLVAVHFNDQIFTIDLWFYLENCVWSRKHRIQVEFVARDLVEEGGQTLSALAMWYHVEHVEPLMVSDEGGIILLVVTTSGEALTIYSPRTNSTKIVREMDHFHYAAVGIYTGSLLC